MSKTPAERTTELLYLFLMLLALPFLIGLAAWGEYEWKKRIVKDAIQEVMEGKP